jgi:NAD(P)-dependent dehydrogenase (short-subunit alcohol dehydrogenase family)
MRPRLAAGKKMRKWYGETERFPEDGYEDEAVEGAMEGTEGDDGDGDAVLVTGAETALGEAVVLQLILARRGQQHASRRCSSQLMRTDRSHELWGHAPMHRTPARLQTAQHTTSDTAATTRQQLSASDTAATTRQQRKGSWRRRANVRVLVKDAAAARAAFGTYVTASNALRLRQECPASVLTQLP